MASTVRSAGSGSRIRDKIFRKLGWARGAMGAIAKVAKWQSDGAPTIETTDYLAYPAKTGDLAYDYTSGHAYVCTVAPTASVNATFVKLHA